MEWSGWAAASRSRSGAWTRPRVGCSSCCAKKDAGRAPISSPKSPRGRDAVDSGRMAIRPSSPTLPSRGPTWSRVAGAHLGKVPVLVREIEPEEEKLACGRFAAAADDGGHEQLSAYARQCGEVLARLHCRVNAPGMLDAVWNPRQAADAAVAFAEKYAALVEADWNAFVKARARVSQELGL